MIVVEVIGVVGIVVEIDFDVVQQCLMDGYIKVENVFIDFGVFLFRIEQARQDKEVVALVYQGNVVELWECLVKEEVKVELGFDQIFLYNIEGMGYMFVGYIFEEVKWLLDKDLVQFMFEVWDILCCYVKAINIMVEWGMYFWDYGNVFFKEVGNFGVDIWLDEIEGYFCYLFYVEDIMGLMCFDYGFGLFCWVCIFGIMEDL